MLLGGIYSSDYIYTNISDDNNRFILDKSPKGSAAPTFSIDSPLNYSLYGKIAPNYSLTISTGVGNYTWYEFLDLGVNSTPNELKGTANEYFEAPFNQTMWNSINNGTSMIRFYVNNSLGEIGYLDAIIRIDIINPVINIIAPTSGYFNSTPPDYIIRISDPNLNKTWYTLNTNQTKHIFTSNGTIDGWKYVNDGLVTINFYANDSVSNENSDSVQITKDIVNPTGSIIINGGDTWSNSTSVTLSLTYDDATSGVLEVRYSNDGSSWTPWEAAGATKAWTLATGDGSRTVYYEVKDNAKLISQFTDTIILDTTVPTGSIIINGGDTWSNSTSVTLSLTYDDATSGVLEVRYSNDGISWTPWEAAGATRAWILAGGDGSKTVYYEVKDNAKLISQFTDMIILDTTAPTGSIIINDGDTWSNSTSVTLSLTYDDATSGVLEVRYSNDGISWTPWEAAGATRAWILAGGDGSKTVYYEVKDNAKLISQFTDMIILDTTAPTGSIIINSGDTWSNTSSISLSLTYGDVTSGVLEVRYSNDGSSWTAWEAAGATKAWTLVGGDGSKTVYYEVKDNAGLISQFSDTIILDTTVPTGSIIINGGDTCSNSTSVMLSLTYGDVTSGVLEVRYSNDGSSWTAWEAAGATKAWTLVGGDGSKTVYYEVKDNAGLISQFSDAIILDTSVPTGSIIINGDDTWSNSTSVTLSLTYGDATSGVFEVRYSNDGSSWTAWEAAGATKAWTLVGGDGLKTVYYEVKDNAGLISQFTDWIILDTTAPTGSISINDDDAWTSSTSVSLSLTYNDATSGVLEVRYSNDGSSWTSWETAGLTKAWTLTSGDGIKIVYYEIKDNVGFISQFDDTIRLDTTDPIIIINDPVNNSYYNASPSINIIIYEPNPSVPDCIYTVSGYFPANNQLYNNTILTLNQGIWDSLPEGEFEVQFTSFDIFGHRADLILTLYKDTKAPAIDINLPVNNTYCNSPPYLNVTALDPNLDTIWYSVNNNNITLSNNTIQQLDNSIWNSLPDEGVFDVNIYANDTFGYLNGIIKLTLHKDVLIPTLIINSPLNYTYHKLPPIINVTVMDPYFHSLWYRVGTQNVALINNTNQQLHDSFWNNLPEEGDFVIYFFANDSAGNINDLISLNLNRDIRNPVITIINPDPNDLFGDIAPNFELSISELNLNKTWYMLYNLTWNSLNYSFNDLTGLISQIAWDEFWNGTVTIRFYANDTLDNLAFSEVTIRKNRFAPIITIESPKNNELYGINAPSFTIYKSGLVLDTTWYTLDNKNFTFSGLNVVINQNAWAAYGFSEVIITFYINNSLGQMGSDTITLRKDPYSPVVSVTYTTPSNNSYCASEPTFRVLVYEPNIHSIWYRVGTTNVFISNNTDITLLTAIWNSLPQGEFTIEIFANDTLGYMNDPLTITFLKDTLAPQLIINQPIDFTYFNSRPTINITVYDPNSGIPVCIYTVSGYSPIWLENNTAVLLDETIWNDLDDGEFLVYLTAYDTFGHINNSYTLTLFKDTMPPTLGMVLPANNTYYKSPPTLKVIVHDPNLHKIWYTHGTDSIEIFNNTEQILSSSIWDDLIEGEFVIEFFANDTFGYTCSLINITLIKDLTSPLIVINSPTNNTFYSSPPNMNILATDLNLDTVWYTVMGTKIILLGGAEPLDMSIWNSLGEGEFQVYLYANDTAGNLNDSLILTLYKDTTAPKVFIDSPTNNTFCNTRPILNIVVFDENPVDITYRLVGYPSYIIPINNNTDTPFLQLLWNSLPQGMFIIELFAEDSLGNINDTLTIVLYKDTIDPEIIINLPQSTDMFGIDSPDFDISVNENNLNTTWYSLIGNPTTIQFTEFLGTIDQSLWNSFGNGTVTIRFYANDTAGNQAYEDITVYKNIYAPIITIYSPGDNDLFGINSPIFTIYKSGPSLQSTWYTIDDGITNFTFTGLSWTIDQTAWDQYLFEPIILRVYVNDSLGSVGFDEVSIRKDPDMPIIVINSPINQTSFATAPFLNLTIIETNLDVVWYSVNNIIVDMTSNFTVFLNSFIWNNLPQGEFIIKLFANDTVDNLNDLYQLYLSKDTIGPNISILLPTDNQKIDRTAPFFEISIFDINGIDASWYTIDGGVPVEFTGLIGRINQELWEEKWDSINQGEIITLRFYSRDTLGNENYEEITVLKDEPIVLPKFLSNPIGFLIPTIGLVAIIPFVFVLNKSRYYKALSTKDKEKLGRVLAVASFLLVLITLFNII